MELQREDSARPRGRTEKPRVPVTSLPLLGQRLWASLSRDQDELPFIA